MTLRAPARLRDYHEKYVKDVVYGFVKLPSDLFESLVDTPYVQRLRWISQTALSRYVYPGMSHDRFSHSVGVAYAMRRALRSLVESARSLASELQGSQDDDLKEAGETLARLADVLEEIEGEAVTAALLHDVGHLPLSHVSESALRDPLLRSLEPGKLVTFERHEELTVALVKLLASSGLEARYAGRRVDMASVCRILSSAYAKDPPACRVEVGAPRDKLREVAECVVAKLLSGSIDVDRVDYMVRDSVHAGVTMGMHDVERLFAVLALVPRLAVKGSAKILEVDVGVLEKGVATVENVLLGRTFMYSEVYTHNVASIYEAMASKLMALIITGLHYALKQGREDLEPFVCLYKVVTACGSEREVGEWLSCVPRATDDMYWALVKALASDDKILAALSDSLAEAASGLGVTREELRSKACMALALLSRGLLSRKHVGAAYVLGGAASKIISAVEGSSVEARRAMALLSREPLIGFVYASYTAYSRSRPIMVLRKRAPLDPVPIHEVQTSVASSQVADRSYAKLFLAFPDVGVEDVEDRLPSEWRYKRGKLEVLDVEREASRCSVALDDALEMVHESVETALKVAKSLSRAYAG